MSLDKIRQITHPLFDDLDLTVDDTDYLSTAYFPEITCMPSSKFLIMYDITETGVLVNGDRVFFIVQFREAGGTWRDYRNGLFGSLVEEESTTPCNISVSGVCVGERMRVIALTDYTNATPANNYFTITVKITLLK